MKSAQRIVFLLLSGGLLLAGCATTQNYLLAVRSWKGTDVNRLFVRWGYPDHTEKLPNGHILYVYKENYHGRYPVYTTPGFTTVKTEGGRAVVTSVPSTIQGGGTYDFRCTTWFEVDKHNRILGTSFRGNNCAATKEFLRARANPINYPKHIK